MSTNSQLKKKEKLAPNNGKKKRPKPKPYICILCEKEFPRHELWRHQKEDHKNIPCGQCNEVIENLTKFKAHMYKKHIKPTQKVKQSCPICGKMITKSVMKRHFSDVHCDRSNKPFKCDHQGCSFAALREDNLKKHKEIHMEKNFKPKVGYTCKICRASFPANLHSESSYINHYR